MRHGRPFLDHRHPVRDGPELEAITGFDEGPAHPDWRRELERRGIDVIQDVLRDAALAAFREFAATRSEVYNARQGTRPLR